MPQHLVRDAGCRRGACWSCLRSNGRGGSSLAFALPGQLHSWSGSLLPWTNQQPPCTGTQVRGAEETDWWTSTRFVRPSSRARSGSGRAEAPKGLLVNSGYTDMQARERLKAAGNRRAQVHGATEGPAPDRTAVRKGVSARGSKPSLCLLRALPPAASQERNDNNEILCEVYQRGRAFRTKSQISLDRTEIARGYNNFASTNTSATAAISRTATPAGFTSAFIDAGRCTAIRVRSSALAAVADRSDRFARKVFITLDLKREAQPPAHGRVTCRRDFNIGPHFMMPRHALKR